ncbi:hypothetical protein B0A55_08280 [Friedmanniomyces simplex]|uniref:Uncharacterized protein n=1 Tax=Friedmanniomyces simplex TaxID=329884 RepID=A0A4U0WQQ5_9PEZI|nr:hypothetical protein B0A55_08280 [Friedmanniomyces simplex]
MPVADAEAIEALDMLALDEFMIPATMPDEPGTVPLVQTAPEELAAADEDVPELDVAGEEAYTLADAGGVELAAPDEDVPELDVASEELAAADGDVPELDVAWEDVEMLVGADGVELAAADEDVSKLDRASEEVGMLVGVDDMVLDAAAWLLIALDVAEPPLE